MSAAFFGIRHLSPSGAFYAEKFLDELRPQCVLIEAPCDFLELVPDMIRRDTVPPFAVMAYTKETPVRSILYPFAEYSPEYRAILWADKNHVPVRFIDIAAGVFLALEQKRQKDMEEKPPEDEQTETPAPSVYHRIGQISGDNSHETFWERTLEHCGSSAAYHEGANLFGAGVREFSEKDSADSDETALREAHMRMMIRKAAEEFPEDKIAVITGSYHVEGLKKYAEEEELPEFTEADNSHTLMPYSYFRLTAMSGYGAGNDAPAYFELLWKGMQKNDPLYAANAYLTKIAAEQRKEGFSASSAQVIEGLRLACSLAELRGGKIPVLRDLRDAAQTCLGEGSCGTICTSAAMAEVGTKIGSLPFGVSRTSIQDDFYRQMKELKLEKYRTLTAQELKLDLRENRRAATEKSAFLDLNRSFFLHRLAVLDSGFAENITVKQDNATWAEQWRLQWTPESEIRLTESALCGDTVMLAADFRLKEKAAAGDMKDIAAAVETAFLCGIPSALDAAVRYLQAAAADASSFEETAAAAFRLSNIIGYGDIRRSDSSAVIPILKQLYYRGCLIFENACVCDDEAAKIIAASALLLNSAELANDFLDSDYWVKALKRAALRDDLNTVLSGLAAALLLERSEMTDEELKTEVSRRLSKGVPADLGAGWFQGLTMKNRYGLIARLSLWRSLDEYIESLDDEEFKRALVFLRRAFADFTAAEKDSIAENLGEIRGLNGAAVSEYVNAETDIASEEQLSQLDDFDFDI